jgi:hypothetical protein
MTRFIRRDYGRWGGGKQRFRFRYQALSQNCRLHHKEGDGGGYEMGNELKDKRGRLVCQRCGKNIARIWTSHRRTETDHRITYQDGRIVFSKLPNDGGIAAYCRDEYLCFGCCYSEVEPGENDESAVLDAGQRSETRMSEERVELMPERAGPSVEDHVGLEDAGEVTTGRLFGEIRWGHNRDLTASGRS